MSDLNHAALEAQTESSSNRTKRNQTPVMCNHKEKADWQLVADRWGMSLSATLRRLVLEQLERGSQNGKH